MKRELIAYYIMQRMLWKISQLILKAIGLLPKIWSVYSAKFLIFMNIRNKYCWHLTGIFPKEEVEDLFG